MEQNGVSTKANEVRQTSVSTNAQAQKPQTVPVKEQEQKGLMLSLSDAAEFCAYKRQKKINEIMAAMSRSATPITDREDAQRVCERAVRLRQAAVKINPIRLMQVGEYLSRNGVKMDCIIGGEGETLGRVKAYEAKVARKMKAKELTVVVAPSLIIGCRYTEIKKELKKVARVAKDSLCKVWVDKKYPYTTLARIARIASEVGAKYFCVPYFKGCERLRLDLTGGCQLEVSEVETLEDFRKMTEAGVGRIVTSHIWEIYSEWMKEAEKITIPPTQKKSEVTENKVVTKPSTPQTAAQPPKNLVGNPEMNYCCRLEGSDLKFL